MHRNMTVIDRRLRAFFIAPLAIVLAIVIGAGSVGGVLLLIIAVVMLATSTIGFCPLYTLGRRALPHRS
jgi:Protein of unknown function (DUF2892)